MNKRLLYIFVFIFVLLPPIQSSAQFKTYIRGLKGKDSLAMGKVLVGSMVLPGYGQAYNRQYWKIPVVTGGVVAGISAGISFNSKLKDAKHARDMFEQSQDLGFSEGFTSDAYQAESLKVDDLRRKRNLSYLGAGLFYFAGALDAVASYKTDKKSKPILPQRAGLYSALLPGLGQAYNGDYWHIPIIYMGLGCGAYWAGYSNDQYRRFKTAYNVKYKNETGESTEVDEFGGHYSSVTLQSARDNHRRNRDLTYLFLGLWYALNIIDANVSAHFKDFDVSDDLSLRFEPVFIDDARNVMGNALPAVGLGLKLRFKNNRK